MSLFKRHLPQFILRGKLLAVPSASGSRKLSVCCRRCSTPCARWCPSLQTKIALAACGTILLRVATVTACCKFLLCALFATSFAPQKIRKSGSKRPESPKTDRQAGTFGATRSKLWKSKPAGLSKKTGRPFQHLMQFRAFFS